MHEITQITNILKGTLRDLKKRSTKITKSWCGHLKKLTPCDIRHIEFHIHRNYSTCRAWIEDFIQTFRLGCMEKTVCKALNDIEYHYRVAHRYCFLNKCDRKCRLQFAKRHTHWMVKDWARVIWTDEIAVKLYIAWQSKDFDWRKADEECEVVPSRTTCFPMEN